MNEADSELIAASFRRQGVELTSELTEADAVVVNTCTVRQRAEDKAISQIGRLRKWKLARPERRVFVVGCAAEKLGAEKIKSQFNFVDEVIGAKSIDSVDAAVEKYYKDDTNGSRLTDCRDDRDGTMDPGIRRDDGTGVSAFVTIMRGCSLKCSYCVVPSVRGPAVCLPPEAVLAKAAEKAAAGAREIILLGQTVNSYSWEWGGNRVSFADLLERTAAIPGVSRVRFMSPHPLYFDDAFFRVFRDNPKIARYVHLPVQSGSDRILKAMRRGYTRAQYLEIIRKIRAAAPEAAVSTDFIVGYPGETEADFRESLSLVGESGVSFAYCFKYSPRGQERGRGWGQTPVDTSPEDRGQTPAGEIPTGEIPAEETPEREMEERLERLLAEVKKNSNDILNKRIGRIEEVLLEAGDRGRSSANFVVRLESGTGLEPGSLVRAEITGKHKNTLKGRHIP